MSGSYFITDTQTINCIAGTNGSTSTSSFEKKNVLALRERSKNKLMQAFQELDKHTHRPQLTSGNPHPLLSLQYADRPSTWQMYARLLG